MRIIEIIDKKRGGNAHSQAEINGLVQSVMAGEIPDYQLSAWLMAVCCRGLSLDETTWLTQAYVESGTCLDLSGIEGVVVDKHSTGGVGDKATLVLIPLLAAAGVKVAKLSGRGLGFTGGTADKFEAIPGFQITLSNKDFIRQIKNIGVAISTQTSDLAPADGIIYALRDVTATVQSIPLIAASVVSKKIAAGAQVIVLDIKYGRGAFMESLDDAKALAHVCREIGSRLGKAILTVISSMEQPLGNAIGHTLEVVESIKTLKGRGPKDLEQLCLILGGVALVGAGLCDTLEQAQNKLKTHIDDESGLEKFKALVKAQSGDMAIFNDDTVMPQAKAQVVVTAKETGYLSRIDSLAVAKAAKVLGAGRNQKEDILDLSVGVMLHKKVGNPIQAGQALCTLYVGEKAIDEATDAANSAFSISPSPVTAPPLIDEIILPSYQNASGL